MSHESSRYRPSSIRKTPRIEQLARQLQDQGRAEKGIAGFSLSWNGEQVPIRDLVVDTLLFKAGASADRIEVPRGTGVHGLVDDHARQEQVREVRELLKLAIMHPEAGSNQTSDLVLNEEITGLYDPRAVRRVELPKIRFHDRDICIPTLGRLLRSRQTLEQAAPQPRVLAIPPLPLRLLGQSLNFLLGNYLEPQWSNSVVAYRPGISRSQIFATLQSAIQSSGYRHALVTDFSDFFGSIQVGQALEILDRKTQFRQDPVLAQAISLCLGHDLAAGLPQGNPLSGLLANLYAAETFDRFAQELGPTLRYSDDLLVLCPDAASAAQAATYLQEVAQRVGLSLNQGKTALVDLAAGTQVPAWGEQVTSPFVYLGAEIRATGQGLDLALSPIAIRRLVEGLREILQAGRGQAPQSPAEQLVEQVQRTRLVAIGWLQQHGGMRWTAEQQQAVEWVLGAVALTGEGFPRFIDQYRARTGTRGQEGLGQAITAIANQAGMRHVLGYPVALRAGAEHRQDPEWQERLDRASPLGNTVANILRKARQDLANTMDQPVRLVYRAQTAAAPLLETRGYKAWPGTFSRLEAINSGCAIHCGHLVVHTGPTSGSPRYEQQAVFNAVLTEADADADAAEIFISNLPANTPGKAQRVEIESSAANNPEGEEEPKNIPKWPERPNTTEKHATATSTLSTREKANVVEEWGNPGEKEKLKDNNPLRTDQIECLIRAYAYNASPITLTPSQEALFINPGEREPKTQPSHDVSAIDDLATWHKCPYRAGPQGPAHAASIHRLRSAPGISSGHRVPPDGRPAGILCPGPRSAVPPHRPGGSGPFVDEPAHPREGYAPPAWIDTGCPQAACIQFPELSAPVAHDSHPLAPWADRRVAFGGASSMAAWSAEVLPAGVPG